MNKEGEKLMKIKITPRKETDRGGYYLCLSNPIFQTAILIGN